MRNLTIAKKMVRSVARLEDLCTVGFEKFKVLSSCVSHIYIHKELGVVVKTSHIVGDPPPRRYRPPTEWFKAKAAEDELVIVQALVDLKKQGEAYDQLCNVYTTSDVRISNVGWYRGRPVYHDW